MPKTSDFTIDVTRFPQVASEKTPRKSLPFGRPPPPRGRDGTRWEWPSTDRCEIRVKRNCRYQCIRLRPGDATVLSRETDRDIPGVCTYQRTDSRARASFCISMAADSCWRHTSSKSGLHNIIWTSAFGRLIPSADSSKFRQHIENIRKRLPARGHFRLV